MADALASRRTEKNKLWGETWCYTFWATFI